MPRRGNNEGSVYKRKDGRWCTAVTTGYAVGTGKPLRAYYYADTRAEVVAKRDEALKQVKAGTYVKPVKQTVGQWLETWLKEYVAPSVRPKTWGLHEYTIRVHLVPTLGRVELRGLQTSHVQRLMNEKRAAGLSSRTIELIYVTLKSALKQALLEGLVTRNVADHVRKPKREQGKTIRVLSVEEMDALVTAALKHRTGLLIVIMLGTGLRIGEALALEWKDVDLQKGSLRVRQGLVTAKEPGGKKRVQLLQDPKSGHGKRTVPLSDDVTAAFRQWKSRQAQEKLKLGALYADTGRIFTTQKGTPLEARRMGRTLEAIASKAGIEHVNPHALRHTFATRMLERGVHPKVVQEMLGHSDITLTLNTYSHVMPEIKQAAARAIDGMFKLDKQTKVLD